MHAPHIPLTDYYQTEQDRQAYLRNIFDNTAVDYDRIEAMMAWGSGSRYRRQALIRQADELREKAMALQPAPRVLSTALTVPPPSPEFQAMLDQLKPLHVGGNIKPPMKTRDVKPVYPPIAQESRVQGVVILEAILDSDGKVAATRVLRSIPLLDEAAVSAVRQWEFTPLLNDGVPTPVVMAITVNFTLQ